MMKIAVSKIDKRGRITLPRSFIMANDLEHSTHVHFLPMQGSSSSIKLVFEFDGEPTSADEYNEEIVNDPDIYAEDIDEQAFAQGRSSSHGIISDPIAIDDPL